NGKIKDAVVNNDGIKHAKIKYNDDHEEIITNDNNKQGQFQKEVVIIFTSGSSSLYFAKSLG
ncbi:MAG: hypothetical protein QXY21_00005, partial [Candidatus Micrarchaeaceae archaeon]